MSQFQSPEAMRQFWRDVGGLLLNLAAVMCFVAAMVYSFTDSYDKATFYLLVAALWYYRKR